jgi:two-component system, chemotaxis family, chemotaxis protein CheY
MRVLIVDDSRASRMVLQKFMKELRFETIEAENGGHALWLLSQKPDIQLMTVDYHMPQMNGTQLVRLVREKPEFASLPILMISVESRTEYQSEAIQAGVNEYLIKPFTKEMIEEKLRLMGIEPPEAEPPPPAPAA